MKCISQQLQLHPVLSLILSEAPMKHLSRFPGKVLTFFNTVLQILGGISVKYSLSLKSSWLEHKAHKEKEKREYFWKQILFYIRDQGVIEQYEHPLLERPP